MFQVIAQNEVEQIIGGKTSTGEWNVPGIVDGSVTVNTKDKDAEEK